MIGPGEKTIHFCSF